MIQRKFHFSPIAFLSAFSAMVFCTAAAALPQVLNHQGRIAVQGVNFDGNGQFKFAFVNADGTTTYWSNDGTSVTGAEPTAAVILTVTKGLYAVLLGNPALQNMTVIPPAALEYEDVRLRVWFNDGAQGFQQITPDQPLAAVPYAIHARKALATDTFSGLLAGDVTGGQSATAIADTTVTGKRLTGFTSSTGTVSSSDSLLSAIGKLHGNTALKANLASPTFTGTVSGITASMVGLGNVTNTSDASKPVSDAQQTALNLKANLASPTFTGPVSGITASMVGLGNVTNTSDANKPVSTAQQTALNLKANLASPTFTGTVSGVTASMVGLGNVTNTSDADKPVSTAQQTVLDLKANLASPTFTGTVVLPGGSTAAAPLRFISGGPLEAPVFGAVEFDGASLYLTTNAASPVRKTLAFSEDVISEVSLSSITAAPVKPVVAWGDNSHGQTSTPALANVAAVAAGEAHSLALLDDGTVMAWGLNTSGQTTIPAGLAGVTQISAGANFNLARKNDGTVAAWGANDYGKTTLPGGITTATQVAAGMNHGLVLLANGSVVAWGDNTFGQTTVPALTNVIAIAAGYDHCLALKSDGTVVAWGRDDAGQVTLPDGLSDIKAIAAGAYHSLALKSDGTLVAWGWDVGGQVTLPGGLTNVVKIAGGYGFSMALKTDGSVVVWGDNSAKQTTVPGSASLVTHIAAGASHALALRADSIPAQVARLDQDNVFTGKVGIGRTPALNALEVEGNASKSTAGSWLANSDRRIKSEIRPILGALEKLDQVRLVDFRYTEAYLATHPVIEDRRYPNVIAQEFAEVFPDDVNSSGEKLPDGSEILQVDTYPLTIYTAAAVQELHRENQALRQQVAAQELRLRKLEAALGE
jgi:alpha-tubulin suppressor-like RCC1 family protein